VVSKNGNDLVIELDGDLGQAHADVTKVRQSILNLLSNAAKFTHDGTLTLRASRTAADSGESLLIEVCDTGIGIPPEKLEHIFEEFSQAEDHTARNFGGTGLGLAISRRFCRMMGGDITVHSEVGSGSTFTITLPANVSDVAAAQPAVSEASVAAPGVAAAVGERAGPGRTVLVIDDDPNARDLLQRAIAAEGFTVATAASGDEGIRLAREIAPAVITLDVMMPEKDGWAVLRELKADPSLQEIPVIVVSILQEKGIGFALGAADYLTKPVDREVLRRLVARHVGGRSNSAVLVVDDDPRARELVRRALESEHCAVSEAENGRAALERVAESRPDLIVLDLMMPVMGGIEFLRELRIDDSGHDVPVIVLTAKLITPEEKRFLDEQVELVLDKEDAGIETMLEQIHAALPPRS
jgi:CheY-like chemotaxis protein/anti-sigma regulatory factor (Ser/Thr protein kinase)